MCGSSSLVPSPGERRKQLCTLLARGRCRNVSHLRGASSQRAHLVGFANCEYLTCILNLCSINSRCDDYLVRSFYLKNLRTGETRTVTQFHFLSWPQVGVPASAKALLEFRRKVNKSYRGRSCPIVVHSR